jgi:hypothetical protein
MVSLIILVIVFVMITKVSSLETDCVFTYDHVSNATDWSVVTNLTDYRPAHCEEIKLIAKIHIDKFNLKVNLDYEFDGQVATIQKAIQALDKLQKFIESCFMIAYLFIFIIFLSIIKILIGCC